MVTNSNRDNGEDLENLFLSFARALLSKVKEWVEWEDSGVDRDLDEEEELLPLPLELPAAAFFLRSLA